MLWEGSEKSLEQAGVDMFATSTRPLDDKKSGIGLLVAIQHTDSSLHLQTPHVNALIICFDTLCAPSYLHTEEVSLLLLRTGRTDAWRVKHGKVVGCQNSVEEDHCDTREISCIFRGCCQRKAVAFRGSVVPYAETLQEQRRSQDLGFCTRCSLEEER